jgi:hypothetical protein
MAEQQRSGGAGHEEGAERVTRAGMARGFEREAHMKRGIAMTAAFTALALFALGAGVVFAQDVKVNYVPGKDFSGYKTYKWVEIQGAEKPDQIVDAQIRQAIDTVLAGKGLTKATGETADLFIGYQVAVTQERQWNSYTTGGPYRYGGGMSTATSTTINIGTLALDMYDAAAKELVWKGLASKTVSNEKDPEKRQKNVNKAMAKLLKDFPPKPKK